jgi:hypothetical protein
MIRFFKQFRQFTGAHLKAAYQAKNHPQQLHQSLLKYLHHWVSADEGPCLD